LAHFDTAHNIVNSAALELGQISTAVADVFASTDANVVQLIAFLNRVGKGLCRARPWTHLTKEFEIEAEPLVENYELPADFERMLAETFWDRTNVRQMGPAISARAWQTLKARTNSGISYYYRTRGNYLWLTPIPAAADLLYLEYQSNYWVRPFGQTTPTLREATLVTDTVWFDEALMVAAVKLMWLRTKGEDYSAAQAEYDATYASAAGADGPTPILNATQCAAPPLIDESNLPETGYGS
jgi:hypothetical protein